MRDLIQLRSDGVVQLRHSMAMNVAPQRGNAVDVFLAVEIDEHATVSALDNQRLFRGIGLHRRERMPDVVAVPLFQLFAAGEHDSNQESGVRSQASGVRSQESGV